MGPSLPATPRSSHALSPLSRLLLAFISGHGSSSDCRKEAVAVTRGCKSLCLLPLPGFLLLSTASLTLLISSLSSACIQIGLCSSVWGRMQDNSAHHLTLVLCHFRQGSASYTAKHSVPRASSSPEGSDKASRSPKPQERQPASQGQDREWNKLVLPQG